MISAGTRELQLLADVAEMTWADDALCTEVDIGDLFFVEKGGSTRPAKQVCSQCPVAADCLAYALEHEIEFGVWGGLSARQRRDLKRASRKAAA